MCNTIGSFSHVEFMKTAASVAHSAIKQGEKEITEQRTKTSIIDYSRSCEIYETALSLIKDLANESKENAIRDNIEKTFQKAHDGAHNVQWVYKGELAAIAGLGGCVPGMNVPIQCAREVLTSDGGEVTTFFPVPHN